MFAMLFVASRRVAFVGKTRCSGDSFANGGLLPSQLAPTLQRPSVLPPVQVCVPAKALNVVSQTQIAAKAKLCLFFASLLSVSAMPAKTCVVRFMRLRIGQVRGNAQ